MSSDDAASRQDHLPLDDVPEPSADADDALGADPWGVDFADPFADPATANLFSAEIENVNAPTGTSTPTASGVMTSASDAVDDGGVTGLDFPL